MIVQTTHLRRRSQTARQQRERTRSRDSSLQGVLLESSGLNVSVHLPAQPCTNRFDLLRPQSPPRVFTKNHHISSLDRRDRRIRNSKEMRRRRDARRDRRRANTAQILDEQLSRDIDRILRHAAIQPPLPSPARPPTPAIAPPLPSSHPLPVLPTPPRLPLLNFGGLDLMDEFPPLTPVKHSPARTIPSTPSPTLPSIPSWCPPLPTLTSNIQMGEFPMFFDLSRLPEDVHVPKAQNSGHEVQLWRSQHAPQPRKVSRYFPRSQTPGSSVKPPPIGCELHDSDRSSENVLQATQVVFHPMHSQKEMTDDAKASATDLWRILNSLEQSARNANNDPFIDSFTYQPADHVYAAPCHRYDHRLEAAGAPVELDSAEIPFAHANSLTGHANECGSDSFDLHDSGVFVSDIALVTPTREVISGLNELVVDQQYDQEPHVELSASPVCAHPLGDVSTQSETLHEDKSTTTQMTPSEPDIQYASQQALFDLDAAARALPDEDMVDVAAFLNADHDDICWCDECENQWPELLDFGSRTSDDEWADYASNTDVESPSPESESMWDEQLHTNVDETPESDIPRPTKPAWDDFFPCRPSSLAHRAW